jgi:hypothetical protein
MTKRASSPRYASHSTRFPDTILGPWAVKFDFAEVAGRVECVGVYVRSFREHASGLRPVSPAGLQPVDRAVLGKVTAAMIEDARQTQRDLLRWAAREGRGRAKRLAAELEPAFAEPSRRRVGRPRELGPDHFERVAEIYHAAWSAGGNRSPVRAVMKEFADRDPSEQTAYRWVQKAHEMGLIRDEEMSQRSRSVRDARARQKAIGPKDAKGRMR